MSGEKWEHSLEENKGKLAFTEFWDDFEWFFLSSKKNTETVTQLDHKTVFQKREMNAFLLYNQLMLSFGLNHWSDF